MAGGYGCDGGALRWLSVVLQIEGGRELERAERRDSGRGGRGRLRGVARGLGEEAGGGQGKQEVAEAASAPVGHARCLLARGRLQEGSPWWAGPASAAGRTGRRQVDLLLSLSYFYLILFFYFL